MARRPGLPAYACRVLALLCLAPLLSTWQAAAAADPCLQVYVVHMGSKCDKHKSKTVSEHHDLQLASVMEGVEGTRHPILHHYHASFPGFSAKMASPHAHALNDALKASDLGKGYTSSVAGVHFWFNP